MHRPTHHLPHILLFLRAVEALRRGETPDRRTPKADSSPADNPIAIPDRAFVLKAEEQHFWELLAFRIRGIPSLLLGGVRFRRQKPGTFDRQSLVSFLSATTREVSLHEAPMPAHLLEIMVSDQRQTVTDFLERGRQGIDYPRIKVARKDIRFAFDLRLTNPSRSHRQEVREMPGRRHLFRTEDGHVLSAVPYRLPAKLHRNDAFLALTRPIQHTASRDRAIPTMVVHRDYLVMTGEAEDGIQPWLYGSLPFHVETANPSHVLDPDLDSYRAYHEREVRDSRLRASREALSA